MAQAKSSSKPFLNEEEEWDSTGRRKAKPNLRESGVNSNQQVLVLCRLQEMNHWLEEVEENKEDQCECEDVDIGTLRVT